MRIDYYTIMAWMTDGEVIETQRYTKEGMEKCFDQYYNKDGVEKVRIYEHVTLKGDA